MAVSPCSSQSFGRNLAYLPPAMIPGNALTGEVQGAGEPIDFEVIRLVDELPRLAQRTSEYR
jgi:hypothetical protein